MWSLGVIQDMNAERAEVSRADGLEPRLLETPDEVEHIPQDPIPFLGDACDDWDEEYTLIEDLFVDLSGFGRDNEPALSHGQFEAKLRELITEHGPIHVALRDRGQFQGHVAVWKHS